MNNSQKARGLDYVIHRKYKRYARTVAERLDSRFFPMGGNAAGEPKTQ